MIIDRYDAARLSEAFGIRMSAVPAAPVGAGWGRVEPGGRSTPHQHDEIEVFVVVSGTGEIEADGRRHPVGPGTLVVFEPFETHVAINTGDTDLVFGDLYWRDSARATEAARAAAVQRRRFDQRPLFVFSTPPTPNGDLHLGHLSGPYLGADAYVRFQRMNGATAWHLTGSDDFQSYVRGRSRPDRARRTGRHRGAVQQGDRGDAAADGHRAGPVHGAAGRRRLRRRAACLLQPAGGFRRGPAQHHGGAVRRGHRRVPVRGGRARRVPHLRRGTGGNLCEDCGEPNTAVDLVRRALRPVRGDAARGRTVPVLPAAAPVRPVRGRAPPARPRAGPAAGAGRSRVRPGPVRRPPHPPGAVGGSSRPSRRCPDR
ncbi:hypothetical protein GCM10018954_097060 [Kutzneria kofuensis]